MKHVIWIVAALMLLPKLANGTGSGLFGYYSNHDSTAIFRQAAPYVSVASGLIVLLLLSYRASRSADSPGAAPVMTRVLVCYIIIAFFSGWVITYRSAPILLSAFGSTGTSQTVSVMRAGGNVPCKTAYSLRRDVPSPERPGFICVPKALDERIGQLRKGNDRIELKVTGFGNSYGLWQAEFELLPLEG